VNSTLRNLLFWAVLIMAVVFLSMGPGEDEPTFSQFMTKVEAGEVAKVEIRGSQVEGEYKDNKKFKTYIPPEYPELYKTLREQGVEIKVLDASGPTWFAWGINLLPILLLVGFWICWWDSGFSSCGRCRQAATRR
jgi:cell division protease FtsH